MSFLFQPVKRPEPIVPDSTLDEELQKSADDANITLYFINMVVISAKDLPNVDMALVDKTDPYCIVKIGDSGLSDTTPVIQNDLNPVWNYKMNFFVPKKPETMTLAIKDGNVNFRDKDVAEAIFEFGSFFEVGGLFDGELELKDPKSGKQQGTVKINVKCRTLRPVETEIKLNFAEKKLKWKEEEQNATIVALDESEELRKQVISELSNKEQEIIKKADELASAQNVYHKELTEKDKELLEMAQEIETKIKEKEQAEIDRREIELKKLEVETKLTQAEEELLKKAEKIEVWERHSNEELSKKDAEILEIAKKLEEKESAHEAIVKKIKQNETLEEEIKNELTAKEQIILDQAKQIEQLKTSNSSNIELTEKEKEIMENSKELEEREKKYQEAQMKINEVNTQLEALQKEKERLMEEKAQKGGCTCIVM